MPADITGGSIYDQRTAAFTFIPGPVFTNILLADEINRAPAKTQAALLEAMEERQVTLEDETRAARPPFLVFATQNPIEYEGTYPLPEAQLDRFLVRISLGYLDPADESELLLARARRRRERVELEAVCDGTRCVSCRRWSRRSTCRSRSPPMRSRSCVPLGTRRSCRSVPRRGGRSP